MSSDQLVDENNHVDEHAALLGGRRHADASGGPQTAVTRRVTRRLYTSHFLSTWNSRVFEFGAVLYLATVFPGTLLPLSVYALTRSFAAIVFASAVGYFIDVGNRLQVVRASIVFQRLAVAISCAIFYALYIELPLGPGGRTGMLGLLSFLACIEKLCSIMNIVAVEKDWVIVVAGQDQAMLSMMNAQMRRIDLLCKLLGPLSIALLNAYSTKAAILINFGINTLSVSLEYFAIARVYYDVPELQQAKHGHRAVSNESGTAPTAENQPPRLSRRVWNALKKTLWDFHFYLRHQAFLPSIACAMLNLTVLSFGGQMVTYLLSAGYTSTQVGTARTLSVLVEMSATWVTPWLIRKIGTVRAGLWSSVWQSTMLAAGITVFWCFQDRPLFAAAGLMGGTILSRLGLWGFDLCAQLIIQEDVEPQNRGSFSSVEAAWQNAFELLSYASTIVFSRPEQFKWPSLISIVAVASAGGAYAMFVYIRRGHLLHLDKLTGCFGSSRSGQRQMERAVNQITSRGNI